MFHASWRTNSRFKITNGVAEQCTMQRTSQKGGSKGKGQEERVTCLGEAGKTDKMHKLRERIRMATEEIEQHCSTIPNQALFQKQMLQTTKSKASRARLCKNKYSYTQVDNAWDLETNIFMPLLSPIMDLFHVFHAVAVAGSVVMVSLALPLRPFCWCGSWGFSIPFSNRSHFTNNYHCQTNDDGDLFAKHSRINQTGVLKSSSWESNPTTGMLSPVRRSFNEGHALGHSRLGACKHWYQNHI